MKYFRIFIALILLNLSLHVTAQKTYKTDIGFKRVSKVGPCTVTIYKTPDRYIAFFYDEQKTLVKRAIYSRAFKIKSMPFDNDLLTDTLLEYYKNGVTKSRTPYKNGVRHGPVIYYYETGVKQTIKHFNHDKIEGLEISFDQTGDTSCVGKTIRGNKNGQFLVSTTNNYYRYGTYVANKLKRYTICRGDKTISSEYLFKDTLDIQIIDSVILYDTLNKYNNQVTNKFQFHPGYRNFILEKSDNLINDINQMDTTQNFFYQKNKLEFYTFLENNLNYPRNCVENGISGKTYILFVVSKEGHFIDVFAANNDAHKDLKEEAIRFVKLLEGYFVQSKERPHIGILPLTFEVSN